MDLHSKSLELMDLDSESISVNRSYSKYLPKQNTLLGYGFMLIAVFGISMSHIFSKVCYFYNPKITNVDSLMFFGFWMMIYYIPAANYKQKAFIILMLSVFLSLLINFLNLLGISLISVSKSTLVFNLNPIFTMVLAAFSLREKLDKVALQVELTVSSVAGAFIGIFLLSLNKGTNSYDENLIGGLLCAFAGAWCESFIFVLCRMLNIYQIHPWLRPAYIGIIYVMFTAIILVAFPSSVVFPNYTYSDLIYLSLSGFGNSYCIGFMALSLKYQSASKVAPLFYLENVFSLLSDIFIFNYSFSLTDYIGILLISACILIPALVNMKKE